MAACVLHNWCLLEEDADESVFDLIEDLETDVNDYMPASAIVGTRRANAGGNNKREMNANIYKNLKILSDTYHQKHLVLSNLPSSIQIPVSLSQVEFFHVLIVSVFPIFYQFCQIQISIDL